MGMTQRSSEIYESYVDNFRHARALHVMGFVVENGRWNPITGIPICRQPREEAVGSTESGSKDLLACIKTDTQVTAESDTLKIKCPSARPRLISRRSTLKSLAKKVILACRFISHTKELVARSSTELTELLRTLGG